MWLKSLANRKRTRLFHILAQFIFLLRVTVIGGEISSKMEMVFRNRDSSFLQNNVYRHRKTT